MKTIIPVLYFLLISTATAFGQIETVWMTHKTHTPDKIVISWLSNKPGNSIVRYGSSTDYDHKVAVNENVRLHHVEIPIPEKDVIYHYSVMTGSQKSPDKSFKGYPSDTLRIAISADFLHQHSITPILKDKIHLFVTAGDHIRWGLHSFCEPEEGSNTIPSCDDAFANFVDYASDILSVTPFMPSLGNHDRQIRPRTDTCSLTNTMAYDTTAAAYRRFFELPGREWLWYFDIPEFGVRFITVDDAHYVNQGDILQASHSLAADAEQTIWFDSVMAQSKDIPFVIILHNTVNVLLRQADHGNWQKRLEQCTITVSGYGYYAEREIYNEETYYNVSSVGNGPYYGDLHEGYRGNEDNYLLLTFIKSTGIMKAQLKSLEKPGTLLDGTQVFHGL